MDLEKDLPTSEHDIAELRRAREAALGEPVDYLAFLAIWNDASPEELRARPGPRAREPFRLP